MPAASAETPTATDVPMNRRRDQSGISAAGAAVAPCAIRMSRRSSQIATPTDRAAPTSVGNQSFRGSRSEAAKASVPAIAYPASARLE